MSIVQVIWILCKLYIRNGFEVRSEELRLEPLDLAVLHGNVVQ